MPSKSKTKSVNLKNYTILIVDDDEALRNALVLDYRRKGFTVLSAESGKQAFEIVKNTKIHLVVSDIRMPDGDGMSLLKDIMSNDKTNPIVIFVTGFSDVTEEEALEEGAKEIIAKPFDRLTLMSSVYEALGLAKLLEVA